MYFQSIIWNFQSRIFIVSSMHFQLVALPIFLFCHHHVTILNQHWLKVFQDTNVNGFFVKQGTYCEFIEGKKLGSFSSINDP